MTFHYNWCLAVEPYKQPALERKISIIFIFCFTVNSPEHKISDEPTILLTDTRPPPLMAASRKEVEHPHKCNECWRSYPTVRKLRDHQRKLHTNLGRVWFTIFPWLKFHNVESNLILNFIFCNKTLSKWNPVLVMWSFFVFFFFVRSVSVFRMSETVHNKAFLTNAYE